MRDDMQKVIVERPRRGGRSLIHKPRRQGEDYDEYPLHQGIRRQWKDHKELSDNLNPLWRFLDTKVGQPWDDVWSEISQRLDLRTVLGFHVKSHLDQHVKLHVRMINGRAHEVAPYRDTPSGWYPVYGMYVHPETGLLEKGHRWNAWQTADGQPVPWRINRYEAGRRILDAETQIHYHKGQWYEVKLGAPHVVTQVVQKPDWAGSERTHPVEEHAVLNDVLGTPHEDLEKRYGRKGVVAVSKRQISRREKNRHGIARAILRPARESRGARNLGIWRTSTR